MGSEMQPRVMRAQKREIQISRVIKILIFSVKKITFSSFYMELEVFFIIITLPQNNFFFSVVETT
jgi:hypothetical protein